MNLTPYIGIPFKEFGRSITGCDCWGLVKLFYLREFGIILPGYADEYKSSVDNISIQQTINTHKTEWIKTEEQEIGNVILLRTGAFLTHVAVIVEPNKMLHTALGVNSCIERYNTPIILPRIEGFYQYARSNS